MSENEDDVRGHFNQFIPQEAREHAEAAREEMRKSFAALFPPEYISHRRAARKEFLLAAREIINHALARIESEDVE
jgi:hypothetical protein